MSESPAPSAPTGRDPFLDVIRAFAMVAVVANHTMYTLLHVGPSGELQLAMLQETGHAWVTWPFVWELQAFFLPAAALSFAPALRGDSRRFVTRRLWRLLVPAAPLLAALALLETGARAAGMEDCATWTPNLTCATAMPISPLWFLVVLVPLTALTPALAARWHGRWRLALPAGVVAICLLADLLWFGTGRILLVNELSVWALVWFAGFAYADGTFDRVPTRAWWAIAGGGAALMALLMVAGPYDAWLASSPRTTITVLECVVGVSLLMALRQQISARRDHPFVDGVVRHVGGRVMGVFLWHYFAFAVVISAAALLGVELSARLDGAYLVQRLVIIPLSLLLLAGILRLVAPFDRLPYPADRRALRRAART